MELTGFYMVMGFITSHHLSLSDRKRYIFADVMVRKIDQKRIVRELSISFLQACGGRNKALEWIVKFVMIQAKAQLHLALVRVSL